MTLVAILDPRGSVLLGRKTRGIGENSWMLPGGKNEYRIGSAVVAVDADGVDAQREVRQETSLHLRRQQLVPAAMLFFFNDNGGERAVQVYRTEIGAEQADQLAVPQPDNGKSPEFSELRFYDEPPYNEMLADYQGWLPRVLAGGPLFFLNIE
jgi:ADP-ribose pyrophosphatase YjhB (NUDIX family)